MSEPIKIAVLSVGSELLDGRLTDTNSQWIGEILSENGCALNEVLVVRDSVSSIVEGLDYLLTESRVVVVSGGLGPTSDDLTREAVSMYLNRELRINEKSLKDIKDFYRAHNFSLGKNSERQAALPKGASAIDNPIGTAPGFWMELKIEEESKLLFALPGVPRELKLMFKFGVLPALKARCRCGTNRQVKVFKIFGLPESEIADRIDKAGLREGVSYRAVFPEVQVLLSYSGRSGDLEKAAKAVKEAVGTERIFSTDLKTGMIEALRNALAAGKKTIAVAESCTGGLIGKYLTDLPGASDYFPGGAICYSNECKTALTGVNAELLGRKGAVSGEAAEAMAAGIKKATGSDIGLSVTGIAGPDGGTSEKPVGTFYVGLSAEDGTESRKFFFPGDRKQVRKYAAFCAMDLVRRSLLKLKI